MTIPNTTTKEQLTTGTSGRSIHNAPLESDEKFRKLMDALADEVLNLSDDEILAEAIEDGLDPVKEANEVRRILTQVVEEVRDGKGVLSVVPLKT